MSDTELTAADQPDSSARGSTRLTWWVELLGVVGFYVIYSATRNLNKSSSVEAFEHAKQVIRAQRSLGMYHEETLQDWALHCKPLIIGFNYLYGSAHFVVTAAAGIFLFRRFPRDYPLWRNTIAITTALALVGFALYPVMPPRLMPGSYGFVDTLARYPTFWSWNSGALSKVSNQFAAMPSVHCAWALWCACVLVPRLRNRWAKVLAGVYPAITVATIVLTANHYVLDAVAGFATLGTGFSIARRLTRTRRVAPG